MTSRLLDVNGNPLGLNLTPRGNLVVENTLESSIHNGRRFFVRNHQSVVADDVVNFLMKPTEGYDIHLDSEFISDISCSIAVYVVASISDYGTELTAINQNQNYINISLNASVYKDVTYSGETLILATKIDASKKTSASRYDTGEYVLTYPNLSVLEITAEGTGYVSWNFSFSEIASGTY